MKTIWFKICIPHSGEIYHHIASIYVADLELRSNCKNNIHHGWMTIHLLYYKRYIFLRSSFLLLILSIVRICFLRFALYSGVSIECMFHCYFWKIHSNLQDGYNTNLTHSMEQSIFFFLRILLTISK